MSETLKRFEALADRARSGDRDAERTFFSEAARLFPADFGDGHPSGTVDDVDGDGDRIADALAVIRQTVSTGG